MNTRRDSQTDGLLRHLGAAYYDSLHGRASRADVARAVRSVEDVLEERPMEHPGTVRRPQPHHTAPGHGPWRHRVRDVMTTSVITVDRITPFKEITALLADHKISAVPVLSMGRKVIGVVSEADLLRMEEPAGRPYRLGNPGRQHWWSREGHLGYTAAKLMTAPAITIHPDATIPAAARLLNDHHIRRLPVVDPSGTLIGIVSRRDLLSVFLRPDSEIAEEARQVVAPLLGTPPQVSVRVRSGIVTLSGQPERRDMVPVALGLIADIDGVVTVLDKISLPAPADSGG
ncbi:MAG TPA: CBS domain-containing protein [Streptosporangiaceae bacterium]|nr:CBS domain-containing protein [Streptosporangiaceae bacterium]